MSTPKYQQQFDPDWPPPFRATVLKAEHHKTAVNILAGNSKFILQERHAQGYLVYFALTLSDKVSLLIQLELDGQKLINHSHDDLEAQAGGDLNIDTADASGNLIHIPDSTASYYTVIFDMHSNPWPFGNSVVLFVENVHASSTYALQAAFVIWSQTRAEVHR